MKLWRSLTGLIRSWWNVDRIRVSPDEGRLLRLDAGALLTIDDRTLEVLRRRVRRRRHKTLVTYTCRTDSGTGRLLVTQPHHDHPPIVHWSEHGSTRRLREPDITVWRTQRRKHPTKHYRPPATDH